MQAPPDCERKWEQATRHFETLQRETEAFVSTQREPVRGEFCAGTSSYAFEVRLAAIDPTWPLVVGDFIYNTRATLDYCITALVRSSGNREHRDSQFPIYSPSSSERWQDVAQRWESDTNGRLKAQLRGTPAATKAMLMKMQPFYGVPSVNPLNHPLLAVQALSNRDKHRRLSLLANGVWTRFVDAEGWPIFSGPPIRSRLSEDRGSDAWTVRLTVGHKPDAAVYLLPAYDIRFNEPPEHPERLNEPILTDNLIERLRGIRQFIEGRVLPAVRSLM